MNIDHLDQTWEYEILHNSIIFKNQLYKKTKDIKQKCPDILNSFDDPTTDYTTSSYVENKFAYINNIRNQFDLCVKKDKYCVVHAEDIKKQIANLKQVTFEVTDACNLNCKYCGYGEFYADYDERKNIKMDVNSAKRLLDFLIDSWNSSHNISHGKIIYISFYGGEPLLNMPFIKEIVEYMKLKPLIHNKCIFSMTTNGTLLGENIDYLKYHDFDILISLDGNQWHNSYRIYKNGKESFKEVISNIKKVQNKYPDYFHQKVNFNAVLHNRNSVSGTYNFINNKFKKVAQITELNNMGIKPQKIAEFQETYKNVNESLNLSEDSEILKNEMMFKLGEIQDVAIFLFKYSGNVFQTYNDFFIDKHNNIKRTPTGTCLPFGKKMFVTVNGKILPCERIGHQFALGFVDYKGVDLNFDRIADKYNYYFNKVLRQCIKCYNSNTCIQCIFNLEDLDNNPVCTGFTNEKAFYNNVTRKMAYIEANPQVYHKIMNELIIEDN